MKTQASRILAKIDGLDDLREIHRIAWNACTTHDTHAPSAGYGEMVEYRFGDGSTLTEDGRGFCAHDPEPAYVWLT